MNKKVENQKPENKNDKKEITTKNTSIVEQPTPAKEITTQKQTSESVTEPTQKSTSAAPTQEVTDKKEQKEITTQKQISEHTAGPTQKPTSAEPPTQEVTDKKEQETVEPPPTKAQEDELAKEKRLNKQLENLWANGRKQLLNQPPQSKNHSK